MLIACVTVLRCCRSQCHYVDSVIVLSLFYCVPLLQFASVTNSYVRLVAVKNGHELCRFKLDSSIKTRGIVFAQLSRGPLTSPWTLTALGRGCGGNYATAPEVQSACGVAGYPSPPTQAIAPTAGPAGAATASRGCCVIA